MGDEVIRSFPVHPVPERPLQGMTVLVVEDSRFAAEAIRLMCLHSGARIRRADSLGAAHRHLAVYRPTVVIVDLGLPDGSGDALIAELAGANPRVPVLLGMSGDPGAEETAMRAGADGFLAKPVESLAVFQQTVLTHLQAEDAPALRALPGERIAPDPIAYTDDLAHVAEIMREPDAASLAYVAQFLGGVARSARDPVLEEAARSLAQSRAQGRGIGGDIARVSGIVHERLAAAGAI